MFDDPAMLQAASLRQTPLFVICDESMTVLYAAPGIEALGFASGRLQPLQARLRECLEANAELCETIDSTVVRIVPLGRALPGCVAVFFEVLTRRDPVSAAVQRYGLTKRETDVLKVLIKNESSAQMARSLCLAESTIGDHVKSIMRKFDVTKRAAVHSKIYAAEEAEAADDLLSWTG